MITLRDIEMHKCHFSNFEVPRFIAWLNEKPGRWRSFKTVAAANKSRRKQVKFTRYIESMDD